MAVVMELAAVKVRAEAKEMAAAKEMWLMAGAKEQLHPIVPTRKRAPGLSPSHSHHSQEHR
jgi:hypothetical protein